MHYTLPRCGRGRQPWPGGFTLIELLIVMVIIGILIAFILVASNEAVQRAEQRATQSLIAKLDSGITERLEAIVGLQPTVTGAHRYLAAIYPSTVPLADLPWGVPGEERARVIAMFDLLKAEMPDVFYVQNNAHYPLNFAAVPFPGASGDLAYALPLGNYARAYVYGQSDGSGFLNGPGNFLPALGTPINPTTGMYGASFIAAAGFYKNLGYLEAGYDGVDNDQNGLIDDYAEGIGNNPMVQDPNNANNMIALAALIQRRLAAHDHKTARAEALYAFLVEGIGPLGSVFRPEDFTDKEVRDTDGDGLPEFVDSWGEPLQFYRWPIAYRSGIQHGSALYTGATDLREQDPLDPNQQLMAPAWWAGIFNANVPHWTGSGDGSESPNAFAFENYFHRMIEPNGSVPPGANAHTWWDRSAALPRRAFFTKPLVSSGGPDRQQGIARLGFAYPTGDSPNVVSLAGNPGGAYAIFGASANLILIENTAANLTPVRLNDPYLTPVTDQITAVLQGSAGDPDSGWIYDDITNQNVQSAGGVSQ
jgi:prepilin-type N-terminal cleavage/methylation domain-containing protein